MHECNYYIKEFSIGSFLKPLILLYKTRKKCSNTSKSKIQKYFSSIFLSCHPSDDHIFRAHKRKSIGKQLCWKMANLILARLEEMFSGQYTIGKSKDWWSLLNHNLKSSHNSNFTLEMFALKDTLLNSQLKYKFFSLLEIKITWDPISKSPKNMIIVICISMY